MVIKEIEVKDVMTKTNLPVSDFAVNPYVGCTHACKYCYASFMKRFTNHPEPWGEFIDVKSWPEINKPGKYVGKEAFFCSVTDPYQPVEKKYGRTHALLEQLLPTGISISISTKSDLILRDLDLIKQFPSAHVSWSINTLDENFEKRWTALSASSADWRLCGSSMRPVFSQHALFRRFSPALRM